MTRALHDLVSREASRRPRATALVMHGERLTYGDLDLLSSQLANALRDAGSGDGDRVCLFLPKSPWAVIAMIASLKAGCVYVPVDVKSPAARAARIVETCAPSVILTEGATAGLTSRVLDVVPGGESIRIGWLDSKPPAGRPFATAFGLREISRCPSGPASSATGGHAPAHILFTSGSTGEPKGVVITHDNVLSFLDWALPHFGSSEADRVSGHAPLCFDLSTFDVYGAFAAGAELHLVPPERSLLPQDLAKFIRDHELTQWFSVPAALALMARHGVVAPGDFPSLRRVMWCGEVLPTPVLIHWMERVPHATFTNLYGPTEATIASSHYTIPRCPASPTEDIPIGEACGGESLHVLDGELRPSPPGETGDLYISGTGLSPGYYRDPVKTAAAFVTVVSPDGQRRRLYRTGDLAKVGADGLVRFVGRADTQVKCRGHRVELGEVEAALASVKGVAEHAVVAIDGGIDGVKICCAYVPADESAPSPAEIRTALAALLPTYMLPVRFRALAALPRNDNGKIDRPALKGRFERDEPPISARG